MRVSVTMTPKDSLRMTRGNSSQSALEGDEVGFTHKNETRAFLLMQGVDCVALVPADYVKAEYKLSAQIVRAYLKILVLVAGLVLLFGGPYLSRSVQCVLS